MSTKKAAKPAAKKAARKRKSQETPADPEYLKQPDQAPPFSTAAAASPDDPPAALETWNPYGFSGEIASVDPSPTPEPPPLAPESQPRPQETIPMDEDDQSHRYY